MRNRASTLALLVLCFGFTVSINSQSNGATNDADCESTVFKLEDVSRKPRITNRPAPEYTQAARRNRISGNVVLIIVLCRTGKVTDEKVIQGLPQGLTESCLDAAKRIQFEPAEKDGQTVSVKVRIEYNFDLF
jgi:protein TonB